MSLKNNPPRRSALIWASVGLVGVLAIFAPGVLGIDGFDGGFAMQVMGLFVGIAGLTGAIIYNKLARAVDGMLKEKNLLAHWTYTPEEWRRYTEKEYAEDSKARKGLFIMITVISLIIGLGWWIFTREYPLLIFSVIFGIIALTGLTAYLTAASNYRRNRKFLGEVYITLDGVYLNRQIHIWKGIGTSLEKAVYEEGTRIQPVSVSSTPPPAATAGIIIPPVFLYLTARKKAP